VDKSTFTDRREWRKFAFGLSAILFIIASIQIVTNSRLYPYFFGTSIVTLLTAITAPILMKPFYILFSYVGFYMGWFVTRLLLSLLFYCVLSPISLLRKLLGKSFLDLNFDRTPETYWINRDPSKVTNYEKMY